MPNPWGTAISLAAARTIVVRALAHARSSDFPPMTVAVLDTAGELMAFAIHGIGTAGLRADPGAADPT